MRLFLILFTIILIANTALSANARYVVRDPQAWSTILKYCISCHDASAIDKTDYNAPLWENRIKQCILYMSSRGYPRPTQKDVKSLIDFLTVVVPSDKKPPVYLIRPKRGGPAYP